MFEVGRRERQILEAVYRLGRATVSEVRAELADAPSYSAVRTMLGLLEQKGFLRHEQDGMRYVYLPTVTRARARRSALAHVVDTFFGGSAREAMAALLELPETRMSSEEQKRIARWIARARKEGR